MGGWATAIQSLAQWRRESPVQVGQESCQSWPIDPAIAFSGDKSRAWRGGALALVRVGLPQFGNGRSLTTLAIRCSKPSWTSPLTD